MERTGRNIPNKLKPVRQMLGYSQVEVAHRLGHRSTNRLIRWEKGQAMPSAKNLLKLSVLYRTFADQLYLDLVQEYRRELFSIEKL